MGQLAREKILNTGSKLVDGFNVCGLEPEDYFANDPHPNPVGYQKIASCVEKVMLELN